MEKSQKKSSAETGVAIPNMMSGFAKEKFAKMASYIVKTSGVAIAAREVGDKTKIEFSDGNGPSPFAIQSIDWIGFFPKENCKFFVTSFDSSNRPIAQSSLISAKAGKVHIFPTAALKDTNVASYEVRFFDGSKKIIIKN